MSRLLSICLMALIVSVTLAASEPRDHISINGNWRFIQGDPNGSLSRSAQWAATPFV